MALLGRNLLSKLDFTSSRSHRTCIYKCGNACSEPIPNTSNNIYFGDIISATLSRRSTLKAGGAALVTIGGASLLAACSDGPTGSPATTSSPQANNEGTAPAGLNFNMVKPNKKDEVVVPAGYTSSVIIRWGDAVLEGGEGWDVNKQTPEAAKSNSASTATTRRCCQSREKEPLPVHIQPRTLHTIPNVPRIRSEKPN